MSGLAVGAGARCCVLSWGGAGGVVAGCVALCFLRCECVLLLPVRIRVTATSCPGCVCSTSDASGALCLVLHCTAPVDVSVPLTRMAQHHHQGNLSLRNARTTFCNDRTTPSEYMHPIYGTTYWAFSAQSTHDALSSCA